jgi:ribosomal protein L15
MGDLASKPTFDEQLLQRIQTALLTEIEKGNWIKMPYGGIEFSNETLRRIYANIDMTKVAAMVLDKVEEMIATKIVHAMATELSNDVKKILSNNELREDLRASIRGKIREAAEKVEIA